MDMPLVPVFLSPSGVRAARQVYERRNSQTGAPAVQDYECARCAIFEGAWDSYDEVYVALYTLRLTGGKWLPRRDLDIRQGHDQPGGVRLDVMLEIDVEPDYRRQMLLDEWAVADIIDFRAALRRLIPLESTILYVGFGCFMMSFLLFHPAGRSHALTDGEGTEALEQYLRMSQLEAIKQRYRISRFELGMPAPGQTRTASVN